MIKTVNFEPKPNKLRESFPYGEQIAPCSETKAFKRVFQHPEDLKVADLKKKRDEMMHDQTLPKSDPIVEIHPKKSIFSGMFKHKNKSHKITRQELFMVYLKERGLLEDFTKWMMQRASKGGDQNS